MTQKCTASSSNFTTTSTHGIIHCPIFQAQFKDLWSAELWKSSTTHSPWSNCESCFWSWLSICSAVPNETTVSTTHTSQQVESIDFHIVRDRSSSSSSQLSGFVAHTVRPSLRWPSYPPSDMLEKVEKAGDAHIVSWLPHGTSFRVHKPNLFIKDIVPVYFKQKQYKSFQRQLHLYGFQRVSQGLEKGSYFHKNFVRDNRELSLQIDRKLHKNDTKTSKTSSRKKNTKAVLDSTDTSKSCDEINSKHRCIQGEVPRWWELSWCINLEAPTEPPAVQPFFDRFLRFT